jgi:glycosyltransferase involved in cell wall biosynthesis
LALQRLKEDNPGFADLLEIILFGKSNADFVKQIPFKVHDKGIITGDLNIIDLYNAADIFVLPSLEDNLPNTVMESMACGTPVVAFNTGGIPEMIDHRVNGYLAEYQSVGDLMAGIIYTLDNTAMSDYCIAATEKVYQNYRMEVVAESYKKIYQSFDKGYSAG